MSVPAYPAYKDSGVEWLGEVPAHWSHTRIGRVSKTGMGQTILREMLADEPDDETLPVYSASEAEGEFGHFRSPSVRLTAGDLIIGARGSIGHTRRVTSPCTCSQTTIWVRPNREAVLPDYLFWTMVGGKAELFPFDKTAIPMLTVEQVRRGPITLPPPTEQAAIAAFLDRETGKIDALVEEQRRLIALLKEKRQAVISHAVTKGLNPQAPLKPSGIEWLGDIPAHWEVRPLRAVSTEPGTVFIDGDWIEAKDISDDGIRYITTGNVGEGRYKEQGAGFITEEKFKELNCTEVLPQDVLISRLNAPVGRACIVPDLGTRIVTSVDNVIVRPDRSVHRAFLVHFLSTKSYFFHTETLARGTTMQRVSRTILGNIRIAMPGVDEQREIADYISREIAKLDALIEEAERGTSLLQERRAALISAAVTGKIDVRGLVATPEALEAA